MSVCLSGCLYTIAACGPRISVRALDNLFMCGTATLCTMVVYDVNNQEAWVFERHEVKRHGPHGAGGS